MRRTLTALVPGLALLAGCGGGGDAGDGPTVTVPAGRPLAVKADEYSFSPSRVVVSGASGGSTTLTIRLRNDGSQAHDLRITRGGRDLGGTATFGPGQTQTARVTLGPGDYEFECTVGDHAALGMKGTLTVK